MSNISEQEQWEEGIYQLKTTDPVGGGEDGVDNLPHKHLANRTKWLKKQVEDLAITDNNLDTRMNQAEDILSISNLGINQKWQNMTSYRDWGEEYTNTSGKTIIVAVNIKSSGDGISVHFQAYIDGIKIFNIEDAGVSGTINSNTCLMIVPNGSTYLIHKNNDETIIEWSELR